MRKLYLVKDIVPRVSDGKTGYTGSCTHCGSPAKKEAHFKQDGIVVVERYCDACISDPEKFKQIQAIYTRFE